MKLKSLRDIAKYLEIFLKSNYQLTFDRFPDKTDLSFFYHYHVHKFWELKFRSPKDSGEPYLITVIPPGAVHCKTSREFSVDITHHFLNVIGFDQNSAWQIYVNEENQHRNNLIPEILQATGQYSESEQFDSLRHGLIKVVMENLLLLIRQNISDPGIAIARSRRNIVEIAMEYMENYYYNVDLSVSDIARFVGVSPQYLNTAFGKATGKTTRQNLIAIRLNHARELLEDSGYLVKEIAMLTGWRSPFYFSNSYRHAFGLPPISQSHGNHGKSGTELKKGY